MYILNNCNYIYIILPPLRVLSVDQIGIIILFIYINHSELILYTNNNYLCFVFFKYVSLFHYLQYFRQLHLSKITLVSDSVMIFFVTVFPFCIYL